MKKNYFRVYCEIEIKGEIYCKMESPASWFLMTQTGELWSHSPGLTPRPLEKEYKKAIPLFYTGLKDKNGKEVFQGDLIQNESGRICEVIWCEGNAQWDALVRKTVKNDSPSGFSPEEWFHCIEIIGNIYMNPELFK